MVTRAPHFKKRPKHTKIINHARAWGFPSQAMKAVKLSSEEQKARDVFLGGGNWLKADLNADMFSTRPKMEKLWTVSSVPLESPGKWFLDIFDDFFFLSCVGAGVLILWTTWVLLLDGDLAHKSWDR